MMSKDPGLHVSRRAAMLGACAAALGSHAPLTARAEYPERPIRWIVAATPGSGPDVLARMMSEFLGSNVGQTLVIDNRPGAAMIIGTEVAARSAPDGYTLLTADNGTLVFNPAIYPRLPYDPDRDFRQVALLARFDLLLVVKPQSAIRTARELFEAARAQPGKLDYGIPAIGGPHHLTIERLLQATGTQMTQISIRGLVTMMNDLMAGRLDTAIVDFAAGNQFIRAGQLRPLAVCSSIRLPSLPDVPTIQEALGLPEFEAFAWQGMLVPRATPDAIVNRLTAAVAKTQQNPTLTERMQQVGLTPMVGGPEEFAALIASERAIWQPLIRKLNITVQ